MGSPVPKEHALRPGATRSAPGADSCEIRLRHDDRLAVSLKSAIEHINRPLARAAAAFVRERAWFTFGYARLEDHARERFGRSGRWLRNLAALGESLRALSRLAAALTGDDGRRPLGVAAALAVARVASPESLEAWIQIARASCVRDLQVAVRRARVGGSCWPVAEGMPGSGTGGTVPEQVSGPGSSGPPGDGAPDSDRTGPSHGDSRGQGRLDLAEGDDDDVADRHLVRFLVPSSVADAFDETLELFRAVEGREASVTSFVEALVAESDSGPAPSDIRTIPLRGHPDSTVREQAFATSTRLWKHLPSHRSADWYRQVPAGGLALLRAQMREAGSGDHAALDRQIRSLLVLDDDLHARLGRVLAGMGEQGAWSRLMFAGLGHYAEERLRMSRTTAEDRSRAARVLRPYPHLRAAYESGRVGLEAVLVIVRILGANPPGTLEAGLADEEAEKAWVAHASEATIKRLRDEARAIGRRGARPRMATPHAGGDFLRPLEDAEWHASLSRPPGRTRRRIFRLGFETVPGMGGAWPGGDPVGEEAASADSVAAPTPGPDVFHLTGAGGAPGADVFLRLRLPADLAGSFVASIESRRRALAARVDEIPRDEPWPDPAALPSVLAARTFSTRSWRVPSWVGLLALLEEFALTWDAPAGGVAARPACVAESIYIRDGWRCTAPGCTSRRNLEDHHIVYRSRGGDDGPANRTCLCRFHHQRGEHGGLASCSGTAPLGIDWRLGRPEVAAWYRNETRRRGAEAGPAGIAAAR